MNDKKLNDINESVANVDMEELEMLALDQTTDPVAMVTPTISIICK